MTWKQRHKWGSVLKQVLVIGVLALALPVASWAGSQSMGLVCNPGTICIANDKGSLTGSSAGLTLTGSTVTQILDTFGTDLGSLSLSTGALLTGSLVAGGTFAAGGSITITDGSAILFSGTFSSTVDWTVTGLITKIVKGQTEYSCAKGGCIYVLSGSISGAYGPNGVQYSGGTVQQTISTKTPFTGGTLTIENGSTFLVTPEPGTLGLMGTGLVGIGLMVKRKVRAPGGRGRNKGSGSLAQA